MAECSNTDTQADFSGNDFRHTLSLDERQFTYQHESLKATLGDTAYLEFRKAEISAGMKEIVGHLNANKCWLPSTKILQREEMETRIKLTKHGFFRTGKGVPDDAARKLSTLMDIRLGSGQLLQDVEIPTELWQYAISQEQIAEKEEHERRWARERQTESNEKIMRGECSLRALQSPYECTEFSI